MIAGWVYSVFQCSGNTQPDSASTSEDDDHDQDQSGPGPRTQRPTKSQWILLPHLQKSALHTFTGGPGGKNDSEESHINEALLSVFILYFAEIVTLLVVDTNRYYHWGMDRPSPQPDVTEAKMFWVSGNNNTNETVLMRPADRLLGKNGPVVHSILHQHDQTKQIFTHHLVSTTELTRWKKIMIDYGKYRMYLKL